MVKYADYGPAQKRRDKYFRKPAPQPVRHPGNCDAEPGHFILMPASRLLIVCPACGAADAAVDIAHAYDIAECHLSGDDVPEPVSSYISSIAPRRLLLVPVGYDEGTPDERWVPMVRCPADGFTDRADTVSRAYRRAAEHCTSSHGRDPWVPDPEKYKKKRKA